VLCVDWCGAEQFVSGWLRAVEILARLSQQCAGGADRQLRVHGTQTMTLENTATTADGNGAADDNE
jgi:hypothetical protein